MWLMLKAFALSFVAGRTVGGMFGLLALVLVPIAGVLKFIGLPILFVLGIIGAPVFLLLGAIGLPMLFVVGIGGVLLLLLGAFLSIGLVAIKIALPIILIIWCVRWIRRPRQPEPVVVSDPEPDVGAV